MSSSLSRNLNASFTETHAAEALSIALIGPDAAQRTTVANALAQCREAEVREFSAYPPALGDVLRLLEEAFDVVIIDGDSNPDYALELVESISVKDSATVMVYSEAANQDLVVRFMRAGARDFLNPPFEQGKVGEALKRAAAHLQQKAWPGKTIGNEDKAAELSNAAEERMPMSNRSSSSLSVGPVSSASTREGTAPVAAWPTPAVAWPMPAPIAYGTPLNTTQLNATATVKGTFVYTPGPGFLLPVGTHTVWVTFTPTIGAIVQSSVPITVTKAAPKIAWAAPATIPCGAPLSELQLNARAQVQGVMIYSPGAGEVLGAGTHTLSVTFIPTESDKYTKVQATVQVNVARAKSTIAWTPDAMHSGMPLGEAQLNATASVPGSFTYTPDAGEVLGTGTHTLSVVFTPEDQERYTTATAKAQLTVMRAPLAIAWPTPDPIAFGTALGTIQLNATANVLGRFAYTPGVGAVLAAGNHTPTVTFTPSDTSAYSPAQAAVALTVEPAAPSIRWETPKPIAAGTPLGAQQLNATSEVDGVFVYTPGMGELLEAGVHTLTATFTPTDAVNYETARATVTLAVTELAPVEITWQTPATIKYGTALSATELNAKAPVAGMFAYAPKAGVVLAAGRNTLAAIFTPTETEKYATARTTVEIEVEEIADITSLLSAAGQTPFAQSVAEEPTTSPFKEEWEARARPSAVRGDVAPQRIETVNMHADEASLESTAREETVQVHEMVARQENTARQEIFRRQESIPGGEVQRETRTLEVAASVAPPVERPREVRTYKGVVYEKGEDGLWHRQQN